MWSVWQSWLKYLKYNTVPFPQLLYEIDNSQQTGNINRDVTENMSLDLMQESCCSLPYDFYMLVYDF